jgi:hypothetical protein
MVRERVIRSQHNRNNHSNGQAFPFLKSSDQNGPGYLQEKDALRRPLLIVKLFC